MTHRTRRTMTERGYEASCSCGWRCCRHTRELRDQAADAHELDGRPAAPDPDIF
jgi:hypothetical protein